jgi:hypothetical protein
VIGPGPRRYSSPRRVLRGVTIPAAGSSPGRGEQRLEGDAHRAFGRSAQLCGVGRLGAAMGPEIAPTAQPVDVRRRRARIPGGEPCALDALDQRPGDQDDRGPRAGAERGLEIAEERLGARIEIERGRPGIDVVGRPEPACPAAPFPGVGRREFTARPRAQENSRIFWSTARLSPTEA